MDDTSFNGSLRRLVQTKLRCPRCKSRDLRLHEQVNCTTTFIVMGGQFDRNEGWNEPGSIEGVWSECSRCGHGWRVRGADQIDDCITGALS